MFLFSVDNRLVSTCIDLYRGLVCSANITLATKIVEIISVVEINSQPMDIMGSKSGIE